MTTVLVDAAAIVISLTALTVNYVVWWRHR